MRTLILKDECIRKGPLILINPSHPVEGELAHDLVPVAPESGVLLEKQAAKMLCCVFSLLDCGQKIAPVSGYRSLLDQQQLYSDSLNEHGEEFTRQFIALPGVQRASKRPCRRFGREQAEHRPHPPLFSAYRHLPKLSGKGAGIRVHRTLPQGARAHHAHRLRTMAFQICGVSPLRPYQKRGYDA